MTSSSKTNSPNYKRKTLHWAVKSPTYVNLTSFSEEHPNERKPSPSPRGKSFSLPNAPSKSTSSRSTYQITSSSSCESPTVTHVAPPPKLRFSIPMKLEPQELPPQILSHHDPYVSTMDNWPSGPSNPSPSIKSNVKYELDEELLKELRSNSYSRRVEEDVVGHIAKILEILDPIKVTDGSVVIDHIARVLEITERIKIPNVDKDELRLHVFSKSLSGDAKKWWNDAGITATWKELKRDTAYQRQVFTRKRVLTIPNTAYLPFAIRRIHEDNYSEIRRSYYFRNVYYIDLKLFAHSKGYTPIRRVGLAEYGSDVPKVILPSHWLLFTQPLYGLRVVIYPSGKGYSGNGLWERYGVSWKDLEQCFELETVEEAGLGLAGRLLQYRVGLQGIKEVGE
ncbi:hypothetical protein Tco_0894845 [Tanacetum coccineum]|uniref:Reverse transcriptase domain-containing protein n=1 Tax=Tanacetum coccineum TaxID=301880 RepID=A0ABQ5CE50_9ASTR